MKQVLRWLLAVYKRWVSPALPAACRFVPTCSEYAMEAVERHGAIRGGWLAAWRILRCHPLARAGYDPVPQEKQVRRGLKPAWDDSSRRDNVAARLIACPERSRRVP